MRRLVIAALTVLIAGPAFAQDPAAWSRPVAPFKIIDNTYYVGTEGLSAFLVTTPKGHVLIDTGLPQTAALVEKNIRSLGFKLSDVNFLLISHAHFDHIGGLAKIKADTGGSLVVAAQDQYALEKGVYPGSEEKKTLNFPPVSVDANVRDGDVVTVGGIAFTAHLTPGHTAGCTTWTWPVKDRDGSSHTAVDFCGASVAGNSLRPEQYPGVVADYKKTFATAKAIRGDVFLAGHAELYDLAAKRARLANPGPNPFIDRAGYERLIDTQRATFEAALAKAKP